MTLYLGIDPGKTTGAAWCSVRGTDNKFVIHDFEEIPWTSFMKWVQDWHTKYEHFDEFDDDNVPTHEKMIVVCEDFILRKGGNWTPTPVTKQIGVCYGKAYDMGWTFALQQPVVKAAGYRLGKIPQPATHWKDALAHVFFAKSHGVDPNGTIIW